MEYFFKKKSLFEGYKKLIVFTLIGFAVIFSVREYSHIQLYKEMTQGAYALDPKSGYILKMSKIPYSFEERLAEYKAHVRNFLEHFYQFDQHTFLSNMDLCYYWIDKKSFEREIAKYKESNTDVELRERDIIVTITIKDITLQPESRPIRGRFVFSQMLRTDDYVNERLVEGVFEIEDTEGRTFENPHGAIIKNFEIVKKQIIRN